MFSNIRITLIEDKANPLLLAYASVKVADVFYIANIRIFQGVAGKLIAMPCIKKDGDYLDACFPASRNIREALQAAILEQYEAEKALIQPIKITHEDFILK